MAEITRMTWNGDCSIDRQGPQGSWRIRIVNADRVNIVEGMTTTAMREFARQINRTLKDLKEESR